jgi:uncharacterized protein DUF5670
MAPHCRAWCSAGCAYNSRVEGDDMLWTILVVLVVLWALGLVAHIGGGLIHLLLVIAAIVFVVQLLSGRRTV